MYHSATLDSATINPVHYGSYVSSLYPISQTKLSKLIQEGRRQISEFVTSKATDHSACSQLIECAANGDDDALDALLVLSIPYIRTKCQNEESHALDDIIQDVLTRIFRKFRNSESPFQAKSYPAYLAYLKLTIRSVTASRQRRRNDSISLDSLQDTIGYEPITQDDTETSIFATETRLLVDTMLSLLCCRLEREAIQRRYLLGESPAEIAEALSRLRPTTKQDVYRLVERGLRRLSKHPEVRRLTR